MTAEFIMNHLWQSSGFALLAALLAFMLRGNSPKVRYWVWLSASVKFLVPWALLVNLGSVVSSPVDRSASVSPSVVTNTLVQIAEPFSASTYVPLQKRTQTPWRETALAVLWAAGFIALLSTRCRNWYRVRGIVRAGTPVTLPITVPALITDGTNEPGVVGFLRPVLVLPQLLLERLNPAQLGALLTHELTHVRRRDNLFAALHMGVETIFWFHPMVWWIGSRMLEERELACDEEVLRLGHEPTDYVRGILTVCEHYSEAPLPCISGVAGADVKKRLKTILQGTLSRDLNRHKKLALAFAAVAAIAVPVGLGVLDAPAAHAQNAAPKFEVASVKLRVSGTAMHFEECSGDRFLHSGPVLGNLLQWAFELRGDAGRVSFLQRVPPSMRDNAYEIQAKAPGPIASESQCRLMVQALLADRFKLAFHWEERDAELVDLVVARGGPKIQKALPTDEGPDINIVIDGNLMYNWAPIADAEERARTKGLTMEELARRLPTTAPADVADKTGLEGRYKIDLRYSTKLPAAGQDLPADPPLEAALATLGLRLEKHKGTIKVPVLDHIETPDAN